MTRSLAVLVLLAPTVLHVFMHRPVADGRSPAGFHSERSHHAHDAGETDCPICTLRLHEDSTPTARLVFVPDTTAVSFLPAGAAVPAAARIRFCISPRAPPIAL